MTGGVVEGGWVPAYARTLGGGGRRVGAHGGGRFETCPYGNGMTGGVVEGGWVPACARTLGGGGWGTAGGRTRGRQV